MFELTIEKLVYGGDGLARLEGRAVLLPLVLPGERVLAYPVKEAPGLVRACLAQVREASPARTAAECPYFSRCGGCQYQHARYGDQLRYKAAILKETLERIGKLRPPEPQLLASPPWNYRNRAQFKTEKRAGSFRLGYFQWGSRRLLPIETCPISSPRINELIPVFYEIGRRPDYPEGQGEIEVMVADFRPEPESQVSSPKSQVQGPAWDLGPGAGDSGVQVLLTVTSAAPWPETLVSALREHVAGLASLAVSHEPGALRAFGSGHLFYRAGGFDYRISHGSFFQTNRFLVEDMARVATEGLEGDTALDLYCGVGYFALPLAQRFRRVIGVESNPAAVRDLESNRHRAKAENIEPVEQDVAQFLAAWQSRHAGPPDAILLDPPRAGLGKGGAQRLAEIGAGRIVYVSCDPATLARDLAGLLAAGYGLESLRLVDLFPQTYHIESVAALVKS